MAEECMASKSPVKERDEEEDKEFDESIEKMLSFSSAGIWLTHTYAHSHDVRDDELNLFLQITGCRR